MTPRQYEFCRFLAQGMSAQQAAKDAGYSDQYAKSKSGALSKKEDIITEVHRLRQRLNERADRSATDVVNEYARIAFVDRVDFLKEDPHKPGEYIYKAPHELTEEQRAIVEKVTTRTCDITLINPDTGEVQSLVRQEYSYVLSDKANALQQMGRHFGIFDDKLKLVQAQQNPFKNATPEQLEELKRSFVGIMNTGEIVDGEYEEKQNLLPNGQGHTGPE